MLFLNLSAGKESEDAFIGIATAGAALGLSVDDQRGIFKEVFCKNGEHPEAQTKVNLSIDFFTDIDGTIEHCANQL
jgi:hypothetical protein